MLTGLIYVTEFIKYVLFFKYFSGEELERIWIGLIGLAGYLAAIQFDVPAGFTAVCITVISLCCMMKEHKLRLYGKVIVVAVMLNCAAEIIIILIKGICKYFGEFKLTSAEYYSVTNIIFVIILLFLMFVKKKKRRLHHLTAQAVYVVLGMVAFFLSFTVGLLKYSANYIQDKFVIKSINLFSIFAFWGIIVLLIIVLYIYDINEKIKTAYETEKIMKESQKVYYETLLEKEKETKDYRHDMSNHILCLKEMAAAKEAGNIQNYINSMSIQLNKINSKSYDTGNMVLDIIMDYYVRYLERETKVFVRGRIRDNIAADDYMLCTIFSNVIKNAVEEINRNKFENAELLVIIDNGKNNVKIEVKNTSSEKEIKNGFVKTVKADSKNHGIGLKNVRNAVEKCGGVYEIEYGDKIFITKIYLPYMRVEEEQ